MKAGAFSYREPYFSYNFKKEVSDSLKTNSVDRDWGLWGHNIRKIFDDMTPPESVYASINGERNRAQYCFSSEYLNRSLVKYIEDNFGNGDEKSYRFMIMPNDNDLVCLCENCLEAGNTEASATPAISELISTLADKFPKHLFFTSSYFTCSSLPAEKMADNVGVIISTMDLPKLCALSDKQNIMDDFSNKVAQWKDKVQIVYIWDYASNFDDYLTPVPVIKGMQDRFIFFKECGVDGIFLNGSGEDYSSFDGLKTQVLASLMIDPKLNVDELIHQYFKNNYPCAGNLLAAYCISIENRTMQQNKSLNIYGGIREAIKSYLDVPEFVDFYDKLNMLRKKCNGVERTKLDKLMVALSFTRLMIANVQGAKEYGCISVDANKRVKPNHDMLSIIENLKGYNKFNNLKYYSEYGGELSAYIKYLEDRILNRPIYKNMLIGDKSFVVKSKLDEDYTDYKMLIDGVPGFRMDYHVGWHIGSIDDLLIMFDTKNLNGAKNITLSFLADSKHRIYPPLKVEIYKDNTFYKAIQYDGIDADEPYIQFFNANVDFSNSKQITLKVYRTSQPRAQLACDEILID
ncbi:MAG: DUF4838 domain-containing protein [Bacteroidales bacterium]